MSSELLYPQGGSLESSVAGAGPGNHQEQSPLTRPTSDGAAFVVDWQVRPRPPEAAAADPVPRPKISTATPAYALTFDIARALGTVVVTARGTLDRGGSRALKHVLDDLIENQGNMTVVVDLYGVTDVAAGCLDIFVAAHGSARIRGGQLSLTGARQRVAAALEASGVARLVKVTSDRILVVPAPAAATESSTSPAGNAHI